MALLFLESFNLDSGTGAPTKWTPISSGGLTYVAGRTGNCLRCAGSADMRRSVGAGKSTLIVGMAFKYDATATQFLQFWKGGAAQCGVRILSNGTVTVLSGNNSSQIGASAAGVVPVSTWVYIEAKITFSTTTGSAVIRVNGTEVLNVSNVNTARDGGGTTADEVGLYNSSGFYQYYFDDLYICDTLGGMHDDFLGDLRVAALLPTSDTHGDFTPSTGTSHYALVDEVGPNTTDYNSSNTVGQYDTFGHADLPAEATNILGFQVSTYAQKDDAGARSLSQLVKTAAGTYETSPATSLGGPGGWASIVSAFDKDPNDSSALSVAKINALETGYKVAA